MKYYNLVIIFLIFILFSCSKNNNANLDCIDAMLEELEMVEYLEQEIKCKYFLQLYHHNNEQYFLLGNHCVDMITYPIDCEGNKLCENGEDLKCRNFYNNASLIGTVGISE